MYVESAFNLSSISNRYRAPWPLLTTPSVIPDNAEKDRKGQLRLPPLCVESSRPSLAWDAAFFNTSGVEFSHV